MTAKTSGLDERLLMPADIAVWKGWSRVHAWRWLKALHVKYGDSVVWLAGKKGRTPTTNWLALERVKEANPPPIDPRIERRLAALERKLGESETRQDGMASQLVELKRKDQHWTR